MSKTSSDSEPSKKNVDPFKDFIAGGVGGVFLVIIGHPPDTIKVRLQTMPRPKQGEVPLYKGTIDCVKKTIKKEVNFSDYQYDKDFLS
jgi:solute carrier family 25 carnitine/acylcarnitine transporter 20/29